MAENHPWETENYWVGEVNYAPEVQARARFPEKLEILDTTLRDGEGTPGVVFRPEEKIEIARRLDAVGVHRIEVGIAAANHKDEFDAIRGAVALEGRKASIWAMSRTPREQLDRVLDCKVDGVLVVIPVGEPSIKLGETTRAEILSKSLDGVRYVKDRGARATFFPMDGTRANVAFYKDLIAEVSEKAGPDSVAVVDTRGVASPEAISYLVSEVKRVTPLPVEVHVHNDFGLGVGNALAGVFAGAEVVHTSVSGLGERCGNTPLEGFALALEVLYGRKSGIVLDQLHELAQYVATCTGVPIGKAQPVVGEFCFVRATGTFVENLRAHSTMLFPYRPEMVGRQYELWLGKVASAASVKFKLEQHGLSAPEGSVETILAAVKDKATREKRCITDDEFLEIVRHVTS